MSMRRLIILYVGIFVLLVAVFMVAFVYFAKKQVPQVHVVPNKNLPQMAKLIDRPGADTNAVSATQATTEESPREKTEAERERELWLEKTLKDWQDAMDSNDENDILAESRKIMKHEDPEVRLRAVEGFAWIDAKGLVPLTEMLYDPDPEVAKEAAEKWLNEMRNVEDENSVADLLDVAAASPDGLNEDTYIGVLDMYEAMKNEYLAACKVYEIYKNTNNPEYISHALDALNFILQPEDRFEYPPTPAMIKEIERLIKEKENQPVEPEDDDE